MSFSTLLFNTFESLCIDVGVVTSSFPLFDFYMQLPIVLPPSPLGQLH